MKAVKVVSLAEKVRDLYMFGNMSGLSLAESCILFYQEKLTTFPISTISMETRILLLDIQNEKDKR